jgi:hypothetical protein
VVAAAAMALGGCQNSDSNNSWFDIGSPNDMTSRQRESRDFQPIPKATEMPPGLGEDLPAPTTQPLTSGQ